MVIPRTGAAAIVIGSDGGERLSGTSKADLMLGGERLVDRVCEALLEACGAGCVVVVPPVVRVPDGVPRALGDSSSGGPLADINAGLRAPSVGDDVLVVVVSVDAPGVGTFLPVLPEPASREGVEGRIVRGEDPKPFDRYLMDVYRAASLRHAIDEAVATYGSIRGMGVRRVLRAPDVERVSVSANACRDIDTLENVVQWETSLSN